jgi:xanthine dehydrogenase YagS FAD-binding subunit
MSEARVKVKDIMAGFALYQPGNLADALTLLNELGPDAWKLAGGNDSFVWFKEGIKQPKAVVDLAGLEELRGIRATPGGIEIGALTTLTEVERNPLIREKYRLLADAARAVASPQIRHTGTIGGNAAQDARCPYYRYGLACYRAGGNICFADTPTGVNRDHALFDTERCVAASPSDTGPALVALGAQMVVRSAKRERVLTTEEFFVGPGKDITRMTALEPNELLVAIRLPAAWAGSRFYFEKVADRQTWDFPLVNVAAAIAVENGTITRARIACGAVSAVPHRLVEAERVLLGKAPSEALGREAGAAAVRRARALTYNGYKIPLMANLVMRAVRDATGGEGDD